MKKRRKERGCCQNQRQAGCPSQQASLAGAGYAAKKELSYWANTNTTILMDKYENNYWGKQKIEALTEENEERRSWRKNETQNK